MKQFQDIQIVSDNVFRLDDMDINSVRHRFHYRCTPCCTDWYHQTGHRGRCCQRYIAIDYQSAVYNRGWHGYDGSTTLARRFQWGWRITKRHKVKTRYPISDILSISDMTMNDYPAREHMCASMAESTNSTTGSIALPLLSDLSPTSTRSHSTF